MAIHDSLFVDVSSLNVLYKSRDKFVTALNFSSGIDRLCVLTGTSPCVDVYLCVRPRSQGDGNLVIDELSLSAFPFTCDQEEIKSVVRLFSGMRGVSNIYICNWVHNFIEIARVPTFTSVVFYGDYVLRLDVKDKLLESCSFYRDVTDFSEKNEDDPSFYGDVGLVDVNSIKAQYPEFSSASKQQIAALAPLIMCYKTTMRVDASRFIGEPAPQSSDAEDADTSAETPVPAAETEVTVEQLLATELSEPQEPIEISKEIESISKAVEDAPRDEEVTEKVKTPSIYKFLGAVACICAFAASALFGMSTADLNPVMSVNEIADAEERLSALQQLAFSYAGAHTAASSLVEILTYAGESGVSYTLLGFESVPEGVSISFAVKEEKETEMLKEHLEQEYTVYSLSDLGATSQDGTTMYRFSVILSI